MRKIIITTLLLGICSAAFAQNLNPQVEVENIYEGKVMEVNKQSLEMNVPDSLLDFNLNFDYSVFENPYRGSYDFEPYLISMRPEQRPYDGKNLYFKAGVGYTFHPVIELVITPALKKNFKMNFYNFGSGFMGSYKNIFAIPMSSTDPIFNLDYLGKGVRPGHDLSNKVGLNMRADIGETVFSLDAGYRYIASRDTIFRRSYHAAEVTARLKSKSDSQRTSFYDAIFDVVAASDNLPTLEDKSKNNQLSVEADITLGKKLSLTNSAVLRVGADMAIYDGSLSSSVTEMWAIPQYRINTKRLDLSLGAKFSYITSTDKSGFVAKMHSYPSNLFYPDVHFGLKLIPGGLRFFADLTGGSETHKYSDLVKRHHFINPQNTWQLHSTGAFLDNSVHLMVVNAGFEGTIFRKLQYKISGGYGIHKNMMMDGVFYTEFFNDQVYHIFQYADYNNIFASADFKWQSERLEINAFAIYNDVQLQYKESLPRVIKPSLITAGADITLNFNKRIYFGVGFDTATERVGRPWALFQFSDYVNNEGRFTIPPFVNLCVDFEYKFNDRMSFWVSGKNILNENIQRSLIYAENGINLTAGICINM